VCVSPVRIQPALFILNVKSQLLNWCSQTAWQLHHDQCLMCCKPSWTPLSMINLHLSDSADNTCNGQHAPPKRQKNRLRKEGLMNNDWVWMQVTGQPCEVILRLTSQAAHLSSDLPVTLPTMSTEHYWRTRCGNPQKSASVIGMCELSCWRIDFLCQQVGALACQSKLTMNAHVSK